MLFTDCEFQIFVNPEDVSIRDNAIASGDDKADRECEDRIMADLENGNEWAWCGVEVRATLPGTVLSGSDFLGCCSFTDKEDFCTSGCYDDMKAEAYDRLIIEVERVERAIAQDRD